MTGPSTRGTTPGPLETTGLRQLTPTQWRSGIAAWLGWLFDGLDIHLYTLIAAPLVMQLLAASSPADPVVRSKSSWIQAAFLVGWALGGTVFGRLGDRLGRSRTLALTILTYAGFTGLSFFAQTWWQLLLCRFLAALGIGGEWGVGSALLAETWPKAWRPWLAAILQTGVNLGVLAACAAVYLLATITEALSLAYQPRWVFLVGVLPALLVFWIRRRVPEPATWKQAAADQRATPTAPRLAHLFCGSLGWLTLKACLVCALGLSAWWAFMFWHAQHLRNLPELATSPPLAREKLVSKAFFLVITVSMAGNFFASWLARWLGYRRGLALMFLGFFLSMAGAFVAPWPYAGLVWGWFPAVGFFSGVFGLFTMYLPPLFPVLLRTTGAGFCFNFGRLAAAFGTVFFGLFAPVGNFRQTLLLASLLLLAAAWLALRLPEPDRDA